MISRRQKIELLKQIQAGQIAAADLRPAQIHVCYEMSPGMFSIPGTDQILNRLQFNRLCESINRPQDKIILYAYQEGNAPLEE